MKIEKNKDHAYERIADKIADRIADKIASKVQVRIQDSKKYRQKEKSAKVDTEEQEDKIL